MDLEIHLRSAVALLGRFPALAGVDLDVACGEVVALQGANGAGKTTVLRACAGLVPLVAGTAVVLGHDLRADRRAVRRDVGFVAHAGHLYDDLTVAENVRFAVKAAGGDPGAVDEALDRVGLSGRLRDVAAAHLSAGQRRRVALAALVARRPPLWLLDEPHAGLDTEARDVLDDLVRDAVGRAATVVIASHEHERVSTLAARAVVVAGGTTTSDGAPAGSVGDGARATREGAAHVA